MERTFRGQFFVAVDVVVVVVAAVVVVSVVRSGPATLLQREQHRHHRRLSFADLRWRRTIAKRVNSPGEVEWPIL